MAKKKADASAEVEQALDESVKDLAEEVKEVLDETTKKNKKNSKTLADEAEMESIAPKPKKIEKVRVEDVAPKGGDNTLIPLNDYIRSGTYIGTKVITPHMRPFIYRRRNDGIAIINTNIIDEKLKEAAKFLGDYNPENVIVVCKRESGWRAIKLFSELTGIKVFTKKYPAGVITNTTLPDFFETELIVICDPWIDKNALNDALKMKKKVLALCDTNNFSFGVDKVIPCNNKSNKSLGIIFYVLAREYMKIQRINKPLPPMKEFIGEELEDFIKEKKVEKERADELEKAKSKVEKLLKSNDEDDD
jgi:small subunit ribosomal protein S2